MARTHETLTSLFSDIADSIRAKKGSSGTIVADNFPDEIDSIPSGGGSIEEKDVNFYDYEGNLTNSYTKNEFLALDSLPELPTSEDMTYDEWNYDLATAKSYVTNYGKLDIGGICHTTDGSIIIEAEFEESGKSPWVTLSIKGTINIDWGDNTTPSVVTSSTQKTLSTNHTYASGGFYKIKITGEAGTTIMFSTSSYTCRLLDFNNSINQSLYYNLCVKKIKLSNTVKFNSYEFYNLRNLKSINVPNHITHINSSTFSNCSSLKRIILPKIITGIDTNAFSYCSNLENIIFGQNTTSISNITYCDALKKLYIPEGITNATANNNRSLEKIIIPNSMNRIGGFQNSYIQEFVIGNNITTIDANAFQSCYVLKKCVFPSSVTTNTLAHFRNCYSLIEVKIPNNFTSIGLGAFNSCYSIQKIDFTDYTSVPTLSATSVFSNTPNELKIVVPDDLYNDWITATNWSASTISSKIVKESDYNA